MWITVTLGTAACLAFIFVMFVVVPRKVLKIVSAKLDQRIAATIPADQIVRKDAQVMSFGLESRGVFQGRGNGALVLTSTHLRWFQFTPHSSDVSIPLDSITAIGTKRAHLGKSYGRPLLHVSFTDGGKPDSMAWFTTDVSGWVATLERARVPAPAAPAAPAAERP